MRRILVTAMCALGLMTGGVAQKSAVHTFEQGKGTFLLDGKPFVVRAAELHYARIPSDYWEHRILSCKALGMNAVCLYVFWNLHEEREGVYDFSGEKDIAKFIGLCKKHGMWVILRPGPYVCAEWEMGGLPWWLLKHDDMKLRSEDPNFMTAMKRFEKRVAEELSEFRLENGGNILMVQVENEYGSYDTNKPYVTAVRDALREAGWDKTTLFQCDWSTNFEQNGLEDLVWTMNFGTNANVDKEFRRVSELRPDAPRMCSEYWSGWFDGWGTAHQTRPASAMVNGIDKMLSKGISFSLYMTHGGTSFGHWAGSNNKGFAPDCTSYDYDAPINEQGSATEKYHLLRETLQKYSDKKLPAVPKDKPIICAPTFSMTEVAPFFAEANLPVAIKSESIKPMEKFDMGYGSMIYSCHLPATESEGLLTISDVHDFATVMVDGKVIGRLYRGQKENSTLRMPALPKGGQLDIFVEAMGRINYSKLIHDRKGITDRVELSVTTDQAEVTYKLRNWDVRLLPVDNDKSALKYESAKAGVMGYYRGTFSLKKTGDTWFDMSKWGKGLVWVNGHCIGRFWNVGPQQALFVPGCWLKKGVNDVVVMDVVGPESLDIVGLDHPVVDVLHKEKMPNDAVKAADRHRPAHRKDDGGQANDAAPGAQ